MYLYNNSTSVRWFYVIIVRHKTPGRRYAYIRWVNERNVRNTYLINWASGEWVPVIYYIIIVICARSYAIIIIGARLRKCYHNLRPKTVTDSNVYFAIDFFILLLQTSFDPRSSLCIILYLYTQQVFGEIKQFALRTIHRRHYCCCCCCYCNTVMNISYMCVYSVCDESTRGVYV